MKDKIPKRAINLIEDPLSSFYRIGQLLMLRK